MRYAKINKRPRLADNAEQIARYLPANYEVVGETDTDFIIAGEDNAGWTLDDYVLPRLASGLIWGQEITQKVVCGVKVYEENRGGFRGSCMLPPGHDGDHDPDFEGNP